MQEEIWRDIPGFEGYYQASSEGRIKSLARRKLGLSRSDNSFTRPVTERIMKSSNGSGYLQITLCKNEKRYSCTVHRLVLSAFVPADPVRRWVNHKDGNKTNNVLSNLEWVTISENTAHGYRVLGRKPTTPSLGKRGANNKLSKPVEMYRDGQYVKRFASITEAAEEIGSSTGNIGRACRKQTRRVKGYQFKSPREGIIK